MSIDGHGEAVRFMKKFKLPMLVTGGPHRASNAKSLSWKIPSDDPRNCSRRVHRAQLACQHHGVTLSQQWLLFAVCCLASLVMPVVLV